MAFDLNETTLLSAVSSGSIFSIINTTLFPSYGIYYNSVDPNITATIGGVPFSPTAWISVERGSDATIVNSPIENGSYTSYNKVKRPAELHVRFALEGLSAFTGSIPNITNFSLQSRASLIAALDQMIATASTFNIETPDTVYPSYDLGHYDFVVKSDAGVTLLIVNATFQAVMQTGEVTIASSASTNPASTNALSSSNSAISTVQSQSVTKSVSLNDVKTAWSSGNVSLSSALSTTGSYVVSDINSAAATVSDAWTSASSAVAAQTKTAVSDFLKVVT